jgi:hypothetical protein
MVLSKRLPGIPRALATGMNGVDIYPYPRVKYPVVKVLDLL